MTTLKPLGLYLALAPIGLASSLALERTIPLPGVQGRIDHFAYDAQGKRLFVAALGNDTVEVIDLQAGALIRTLTGFSEPQGLLYLPEFNRLYVANGGTGEVQTYDGTRFDATGVIKFDDDADNVRYDPVSKQVFVGHGSGSVGIVDAASNAVVGDIPVGGHPEAFQIEPGGSRVFVNVPGAHTIDVIDRKERKAVGHWSLGLTAANFPMAYDPDRRRIFVATRVPARLLVFDAASGSEIAKLEIHGDCDDLFYVPILKGIVASCGAGYVDVVSETAPGTFERIEALETAPKARTSFVAEGRLYVAVPATGREGARLLVYRLHSGR